MSRATRLTWIILLLFMAAALPQGAMAQNRFTVNGRLKIEGGDLSGTRAVVYKDGAKERTISSGLNKFSLDLDINHSYVIAFEKDGFVSKKISFDTHAPGEAAANGFTPFDFAVSLFKQYDDINIVVFNQPVGMIRFDDKTGDFDYDTDYTRSIQSQLQQVLAQVEKKQAEEAATAKANESKAAEEAKAKAKAEAEATKQAAATAKAAEAKAKADAAAVKEAEAKRLSEQKAVEKAQAEARKAEKPEPAPVKKEEVAEAPPAPLPPPAPKREKPEPPPTPVQNATIRQPQQGSDGRRSIAPNIVEEPSRVELAKVNAGEEQRPEQAETALIPEIDQETITEPSRVTTVVTVRTGLQRNEFRKVIHKFGAVYYFKDGATCTQEIFERGTRAESLAGVSARSKLD